MNDEHSYLSDENEIEDEGKSFFTIIPNIVFELGLSVYAIRLYCELKRTAGERGKCWMGTRALAEKCGMSTGEVSKCKQELKDAELITLVEKTSPTSGNLYHEIKIVDIWKRNIEHFSREGVHVVNTLVHTVNTPVHMVNESIFKEQDLKSLKDASQEKHLTTDEYKEMTRQSVQKYYEKHPDDSLDSINQYPEDIRVIIAAVCELFHLKCPSIKSSRGGLWAKTSRELRDACGEFEKQVLIEIADDFQQSIRTKGIVPYTVSGPNSLINPAIAMAGRMRARKLMEKQYNNLPKGASKVYIGGKVFVPGIGEVSE